MILVQTPQVLAELSNAMKIAKNMSDRSKLKYNWQNSEKRTNEFKILQLRKLL